LGTDRSPDDALLKALAAGNSVHRAAELGGVSERTAWRRLKDPTFRLELLQIRAGVADAVGMALVQGCLPAASTLVELAENASGAKGEGSRIMASKAVLELTLKWREGQELSDRLGAIEERLARLESGAWESASGLKS